MSTSFSIITLATHGLEIVEEDISVLVTTKTIPIEEYNGIINKIHDYQTENETYDIQLHDNSIMEGVPKENITITNKTYMPSLFKIPESFRSFYKINLTSLQNCLILNLDEVTSINNIIRQAYVSNSNNIEQFLLIVEKKLNDKLNSLYKTRNKRYITVKDCLKNNPTIKIVNKYLIVNKNEKAEQKRGIYQDSGIFSLSSNSNRDFFEETWKHDNPGKKYDTKEQRDISLKELVQYITPETSDLVIFDLTCFGIGINRAGLEQCDQYQNYTGFTEENLKEAISNVIVYPYGGKKKRRKTKKQKTKIRKTKRRKFPKS